MDETRTLPSQKQQSWGALIAIVVVVLMVIMGAFYAWEKRASQEQGAAEESAQLSQ